MRKEAKVAIILVLILVIGGLYYSKNISGKKNINKAGITTRVDEIIKVEKGELKKPAIMQLSTTTCPACREMYPIMESIDKKYGDKVVVGIVYLDDKEISDQASYLAKKYSVMVVPTIVFLDEYGQQLIRHEGFLSEEEITNILNQMGVK
ncbi:thioredoxin fold domain-containing protein [Clostridium bovifaecis]|uniref:Thioredoxin fold domain-containing protein n=1 Tax=Clostridium bovifaecis TaxID=2184719 RepID=A0A6I6EJP3_9CLOT|nr:thioredoxin fold domain-containing protein [Clostridium bovifaecis]